MARCVLTEREAGRPLHERGTSHRVAPEMPENRLAVAPGALSPPPDRPGDAVLERLPRAPARLALEAPGVGDEERRVVGPGRECAGADEVLAAGLARDHRDDVAHRHTPARGDVH